MPLWDSLASSLALAPAFFLMKVAALLVTVPRMHSEQLFVNAAWCQYFYDERLTSQLVVSKAIVNTLKLVAGVLVHLPSVADDRSRTTRMPVQHACSVVDLACIPY